jgi:hypothetical protein
MVRAACAQRGDEFRQPTDDPGAGYGIAVVARAHDLAVPDRQDHQEAQRERLGGLGELAVQLVPSPGLSRTSSVTPSTASQTRSG